MTLCRDLSLLCLCLLHVCIGLSSSRRTNSAKSSSTTTLVPPQHAPLSRAARPRLARIRHSAFSIKARPIFGSLLHEKQRLGKMDALYQNGRLDTTLDWQSGSSMQTLPQAHDLSASSGPSSATRRRTQSRAPSEAADSDPDRSASDVVSSAAAPPPPKANTGASATSNSGQKPKRKKATRACNACQKAHLTCDDCQCAFLLPPFSCLFS